MTPEQILGVAQVLAESQVAAPSKPAPAPPAPAFDIADDDYIDGRTAKRMLAEFARPQRDTTAVALAADANLSIVRSKYARDFERWGNEIAALVEQVPHEVRTLDNLERVVKMVRSDHLDEIAGELAQQRIAGMEPTLRSNGAAAPPAPITREESLDSEKIPPEWLERARKNKITESVVDEWCRANGISRREFYAQFDKPLTPVVGDISNKQGGVSTSA